MRITDFKYCLRCQTTKHRDEYHNNVRSTDGKAHWCKPCMLEAGKRSRIRLENMRAALWGRA